MSRLIIVTVGKTHSGKTTFAKLLEEQLDRSLLIDQDNHAEFINRHYRALLPKSGPNTLKYGLTQMIVDYAVSQTDFHLIFCNGNRARAPRVALLDTFHKRGFTSIIVSFKIPNEILKGRIATTKRSKNVFRHASSFDEVLARQEAEEKRERLLRQHVTRRITSFLSVVRRTSPR